MTQLPKASRLSSQPNGWSRLRTLPTAIRSFCQRRMDLECATDPDAFNRTAPRWFVNGVIEKITPAIFDLIQQVPDDCEHPHEMLLQLAGKVMDSKVPITGIAPVISPQLDEAFKDLPTESQSILLMHLAPGQNYRLIAEKLGMHPKDVLGMLRSAYAELGRRISHTESGHASQSE